MVAGQRIAVVFPGQGSQYALMNEDFSGLPAVAENLQLLSERLGVDIQEVLADRERVNDTKFAQPLLLAVSVGIWNSGLKQLVSENKIKVSIGHSLGEYSALVAAGRLDFVQALDLVIERAQAMSAGTTSPGTMCALIGTDRQLVEQMLGQSAIDGVWVANFNAPSQVVLAGLSEQLAKAIDWLKSCQDGLRTLMLPVTVASHCPLMIPAAEIFEKSLAALNPYDEGFFPVIHNASMNTSDSPQALREALRAQLIMPVNWVDMLRNVIADYRLDMVIECGPKSVLSGLGNKIAPDLEHYSVNSSKALFELIGS